MNHQHHLKSDPKFGRFSRFSRGVDARVLRRVMRTGIMVVRWASAGPQSQGLRATVARPLGPRSQGLRGLRGFVRLNFRVAISGVSGVSNPGLLIWKKALDMGGTCETC